MPLTKETADAAAVQDSGRLRMAAGGKVEASGHSQPVCIEVPVTVQGVRRASDPGKREPFTESTRTLIVFAKGAVVRLGTAVNPGQLIFLTNQHTKKEVVCQVVKSKSYQSVAGYIELEFTEPNAGFWGIHFPGEGSESQSASQEPGASQADLKPKPVAPAAPRQGSPVALAPPNAPSVFAPPPKAAESERAPKIESHPDTAIPAEIARATPPVRKEAPRAEERLSAPEALPPHPELIRPSPGDSPHGNGSAGVSEPLVFSHAKRPASPAVSVTAPPEQLGVPAFGSRSLFEEGAEVESAEAKPRHLPVGALIAAGLILAAAGAGWHWWRNREHSEGADSSPQAVNSAPPVTPPSLNPQAASAASSALPSSSAPVETGNAKPNEASGHPSAPATVETQPVGASLTSREPSRPAEKPAESREPASKPDKKPALSGFRMSAPSFTRPVSPARNPEPAPVVDSALVVPGGASPESASSLFGSARRQPDAPKPEAPAGGELKQARLLSSAPPAYPPVARSQRVEGDVTLDALIDAAGRVTSIKIISGPVLLQQAAAAAVRLWKYEPAILNGTPVPMHLVVTVKFRLR